MFLVLVCAALAYTRGRYCLFGINLGLALMNTVTTVKSFKGYRFCKDRIKFLENECDALEVDVDGK